MVPTLEAVWRLAEPVKVRIVMTGTVDQGLHEVSFGGCLQRVLSQLTLASWLLDRGLTPEQTLAVYEELDLLGEATVEVG